MNTQDYENRLRTRLTELVDRMERVEDALDEPVDPDPEERSAEREDDELLERLGTSAQAEVEKIVAALGRIANDTFGVCASCGDTISEERLKLTPHAAQCRKCA